MQSEAPHPRQLEQDPSGERIRRISFHFSLTYATKGGPCRTDKTDKSSDVDDEGCQTIAGRSKGRGGKVSE